MELSEESAVNQEKKKEGEREDGRKKNSAADYFPFFLGFLSPALLFFFCVHCEAGWVNVCVCVCVYEERGEAVLMWRLGVGLNKR